MKNPIDSYLFALERFYCDGVRSYVYDSPEGEPVYRVRHPHLLTVIHPANLLLR